MFDVWVKYSIDPSNVYNPVPSEFYQIEQAITEQAANAKQSASESAESAKQAAASREAIENMEVSAVSLSPDSDATVEKSIVDDKVKLTFGIPKGEKGESDIFWLNTASRSKIVETFDEVVDAYKAGKSIWVRDTHSVFGAVLTAPGFIVVPTYDETNIISMTIVCGGSARGSSDIDIVDALMNDTYHIVADHEGVYFYSRITMCAELGDSITPNESKLDGFSGESNHASSDDHVHPAPFPNWTTSIGKALFVNNDNTIPSRAFEWRDVPNGDFTSKVGDFLRVAEVDSNNKPTKWSTDKWSTDSVVIKSSTPNSTKKFRITVDDAGTISATEVQ